MTNIKTCHIARLASGLTAVILFAVTTQYAYSADLRIEANTGNDTNPFRLSENFNPEEADFVETKANFKHRAKSGFKAQLYAIDKSYSSEFSDADSSRAKFSIGYEKDRRKPGGFFSLTAGTRDKTFVSRITGEVGVVGDISVADRYDYDFGEAIAGYQFKVSKKLKLSLYAEYHGREYEDYIDIGLSNLDYGEARVGTEWQYSITRRNRLELDLELANRVFDDRRGRTPTGIAVADSELEYDIYRIRTSYQFKPISSLTAKLEARHEERTDNVQGYYDWERKRLAIDLGYDITDNSELELNVAYSELAYPKRIGATLIENEDEGLNNEDGYIAKFGYEYKLPINSNIRFYVDYSVYDFDSNQAEYQYEREQVEAGIKAKLF